MAMEQTTRVMPEEKKRFLVVLQRYPTIETLKLAIQFAETPELKEAATKAAIAIAEKVGNKASEAKALLSKAGIKSINVPESEPNANPRGRFVFDTSSLGTGTSPPGIGFISPFGLMLRTARIVREVFSHA